jgi:NodT family efflux transporter outer membrane factor (OMF) lipoprotein
MTMMKKKIKRRADKMINKKKNVGLAAAGLFLIFSACTPKLITKTASTENVPVSYKNSTDTTNTADINWNEYFSDPHLTALIDSALANNQELNITLQEIQITKNEVRTRKGEYLPFVGLKGGAGVEKAPRYTPQGAMEATTNIEPGREMPEPVPDFMVGAFASWEVDIWNKLHNAKKSAVERYLASVEGRNFMVTNLVAEIANSYYELLALDNQLAIVQRNIQIQTNALEIVKLQKQAARVTELAVRRFEAQVFHTRSLQYDIQQQIIETENRINFLVGRYPQTVQRNSGDFTDLVPDTVFTGIPSQLLQNRPDIRQAELELAASKLDVKVAKANFYPSLDITAGAGLRAFNPSFLMQTPESMLYSLAADITAPLINRNAIKSAYYNANSKQIQAVFSYERTILKAYVEVANQLAKINNLEQSFDLKAQEVQALNESIEISNKLFKSARADYMEVLLTQRDALESKFELIETKKEQMNAIVNIYQALGGGWK